MATLDEWGVWLAVLGLVTATLLMAAVVKHYQAHQDLVRTRVQRLASGIGRISDALDQVQGVPLSRELRVTLRSDIVRRYQKIRRLYRRYPDLDARLRAAETRLQAEGAAVGNGVGPIDSEQALRRLLNGCDELISVVQHGQTLQPIPRDVRQIFCRELGERRAEANARFHLTQSRACERSGDLLRGRAHLTTLLQVLKRRGPGTDFVRELYVEAEQAYQRFGQQAAADDSASPAGNAA